LECERTAFVSLLIVDKNIILLSKAFKWSLSLFYDMGLFAEKNDELVLTVMHRFFNRRVQSTILLSFSSLKDIYFS